MPVNRFRALVNVLAASVLLLLSGHARAVVLGTDFERAAFAIIEIDRAEVTSDSQTIANGPAEATATVGTLLTPSEARASGRSEATTVTSNAEYVNRDFGATANFTSVASDASFELEATSLTGGDVVVDFFLPAGFLELVTQGEFAPGAVLQAAGLRAELTVCVQISCSTEFAPVLSLTASLSGDYFSQSISVFARSRTFGPFPGGGPGTGLDLSPLTDDTLTIVDGETPDLIPTRTITWEYPAFSGSVNLGPIPVGELITLEYVLVTGVSGFGPLTGAAAAINDPLSLTQFDSPTLDQAGTVVAPVPAPPSAALALGCLALLCSARARRA